MELANDTDLRLTAPRKSEHKSPVSSGTSGPAVALDPRLPMPGTAITRKYKGQSYQVIVLRDGFEFEGEKYKSLSAVAKRITGQHWNGYLFFGLKTTAGKQ